MRAFRRTVTLGLVAALAAIPTSLPAFAQGGRAAEVTHRQSVLTEVSPTGDVRSSRVFTQLTVAGDGDVEVALPAQATRGLRNLDGFGKPSVEGDEVVYRLAATRDGASERTVADNTADLPVSLEISMPSMANSSRRSSSSAVPAK
jgi:putative membrane protein